MEHRINRRLFVRQSVLRTSGAFLMGLGAPLSTSAADTLTWAEFKALHQELQPPADELWRTIPWKLEITEACNQGAKEKKPLVLRVRSGHPLGCV
jgi:hypothetical protein